MCIIVHLSNTADMLMRIAKQAHSGNVSLLLGQRRRLWPNIKLTLVKCWFNILCLLGCGFRMQYSYLYLSPTARILVQVTMYHRHRIGRHGHLDQSEACDTLYLVLADIYDI